MERIDTLMIISDLGAGGAQRVFSDLANHFHEQGKKVLVLTFAPHADDFFQINLALDRTHINGIGASKNFLQSLVSNFVRIRRIRRIVREYKPSTVISFIGTTNILVILATLFMPVRVIISERNDPSRQSLGRIWDFLRRRLYRYASIVTANSQHAINALKAYVPQHKLVYVPNPIPLPVQNAQTMAQRENIILSVGRLYPQKGIDLLLRAFANIAHEYLDWRLEIVGDGPLRGDLTRLADDLNIAHAVTFAGIVQDVGPYYSKASIFVLPSHYEGTPNVLLEAMSAGLPVVVNGACQSAVDFIQESKGALIFSSDSVDDLAHNLKNLFENQKMREINGLLCEKFIFEAVQGSGYQTWDNLLQTL